MADDTDQAQAAGILLSDDLLFYSRITGAARHHDLTLHVARTQADVVHHATQSGPQCLILDLENPGLNIDTLMEDVRQQCNPAPFVVAYGSHVDTVTLKAARAAGCNLVLPRSKFVELLPAKIPNWYAREE